LHGGHRRLGLDADLLNAIQIHRPFDPISKETGIPIAVNERDASQKWRPTRISVPGSATTLSYLLIETFNLA
jgi:hypothetical protein